MRLVVATQHSPLCCTGTQVHTAMRHEVVTAAAHMSATGMPARFTLLTAMFQWDNCNSCNVVTPSMPPHATQTIVLLNTPPPPPIPASCLLLFPHRSHVLHTSLIARV